MKYKLQFFITLLIISISFPSLYAQAIPKDSLYIGQTPPGSKPKVLPISDSAFIDDDGHNTPGDSSQKLRYGEIILVVRCIDIPDQSYSLYIPLHYSPEKRWPIVYIFDPGARGDIPVELMKEAAERYGYIIAASNNSRNGPLEPELKAAQAMVADTHTRLAINDSCIYFAGFSGGARVAALLAQGCRCAQGVLLNSAGFPADSPPSSKDRFAIFTMVGLTDFNYDEMVMLDKTLDKLETSHFLRRFDGTHQWAPKDVWLEAFAWMRLIAIKNGRQPRDEKFIADELSAVLHRSQALEDSGNAYYAWQYYRNASDNFQGLKDTKKIDEHIAVLEKNENVKDLQKREENEIEAQIRIQNKVLSLIRLMQKPKPKWLKDEQLNNYNEGGGITFRELRTQARDAIIELRENLADDDRLSERRVFERAYNVVISYLMETAQYDMDSNNLQIAKAFYKLAIEAQPKAFWLHLSLARCLTRMGDKKEAINELRQACEFGLSAQALADIPKQMPELSSLINDPEFQKFISGKSNK